jgi:putative membrane protein
MNMITVVFALLAGVLHLYGFVVQFVLQLPRVKRAILRGSTMEPKFRPVLYVIGVWNLVLAVGAIGGVVLGLSGEPAAGLLLTRCACAAMALGVVVPLTIDRGEWTWTGLLYQAVPPSIALVASLF